MGVVYRIKPNIKEIVIKEARERPHFGCRRLAEHVTKQLGVEVSKSSVNTILKSEKLIYPVGRRRVRKKRREEVKVFSGEEIGLLAGEEKALISLPEGFPRPELTFVEQSKKPLLMPAPQVKSAAAIELPAAKEQACAWAGLWFLKAADLSLGGIEEFSKAAPSQTEPPGPVTGIIKNEIALFAGLIPQEMRIPALEALIAEALTLEEVNAGMRHLESPLPEEFSIQDKEILNIKFIPEQGAAFFLDGKLRSVWAAARTPFEFSQGLKKAQEKIKKLFGQGNQPVILQALAGVGSPSQEFFSFAAFCQKPRTIKSVELLGQKGECLEAITEIPQKEITFIAGLWPWQHTNCIGEPAQDEQPFTFSLINASFALAESRITFKLPRTEEELSLRSVVIKKKQRELLGLLTNISKEALRAEEIARLYLSRWPNLEQGYQDFLARVGQGARYALEAQAFSLQPSAGMTWDQFLTIWRKRLSSYCQSHFFPPSYIDAQAQALEERFYKLAGTVEKQPFCCKVTFIAPPSCQYIADLRYACQRVNEEDIILPSGAKLFFKA